MTEDGGRVLHIDIHFDPSSELTLYRENDEKEYIESTSFFAALSGYYKFTHFITTLIFFQHSKDESVELKKSQSKFCQDLALAIDKFHRLRKLDIGISMPEFDWGQIKNAVSFYPLRFTGWSLHQQLGKGEWVRIQGNSALQKRLDGYNRKLGEDQKATQEEFAETTTTKVASNNQDVKKEDLVDTKKTAARKAKRRPRKTARKTGIEFKKTRGTKVQGGLRN